MRAFVLLSCISSVSAFRTRHKAKVSSGWSSISDKTHGTCAENMQHIQQKPVQFPLLCSGEATGVKISATAYGIFSSKMWVKVDGEAKGDRRWPVFGGTRTFEVTLDKLSAGLHKIHYRSSGTINFKNLTVSGGGSVCTMEESPNFGRDLSSYTLNGLDVLNRLHGEDRGFSPFKKQQLDFASETVGVNADGSIDSKVVGEGFWQWFYQYSQDSPSHDKWGNNPDGLWDEAKLGGAEISLGFMPRHVGQNMKVYEPCNTLSNLAFHEAAIWISCKDWSFDQDEMSSLVASFNGLAAGSAFLHACACQTGGRADTFTMDWLMLQVYQALTRDVVENAGDRLTQQEKDAIRYFNKPPINAVDVAKNMTRLMEGKYDHAFWNSTMRSINIPAYEMPIVGVISFVLWGLVGKFPVPGLDSLLQGLIDALLGVFSIPDLEFFQDTFFPAIRKSLSFSNICFNKVMPVAEHTLAFAVTFVEALVFQENKLPVPKVLRDIMRFLDGMGWTSDNLNVMHVTWDYYNGFNCRQRSDHATWHEKAANGLIHFSEVADLFRRDPLCE